MLGIRVHITATAQYYWPKWPPPRLRSLLGTGPRLKGIISLVIGTHCSIFKVTVGQYADSQERSTLRLTETQHISVSVSDLIRLILLHNYAVGYRGVGA